MPALYAVASYLFIGLLLPVWMLHPKLRQGIRRRLGWYDDAPAPWPPSRGDGPRIVLHGASAGDLLALMPIMRALRERRPDATLIASTMTNSGHAIAQDRLRELVDGATFVPYDLPGATRRAMAALQPDLLVLEYTELWPNLIRAARARGAKVALTNGRLSEANVAGYRWMGWLFGNVLEELDLLLMREEVEAERARALGAPPARVRATGNTKFDNLVKAPTEAPGLRADLVAPGDDAPWFVAGSTHEGEERDVIRAFVGMRAAAPRLRLMIAPRYVERAGKVAALARAEGLRTALRSEAASDPEVASAADVVLLDTMGELATAYGLARLVFVGGSFVTRGGQNILEPAGQGRPVLFGPHMQNFRDSVEVLLGRGGIQVETPAQLARVAAELLRRPEELDRLGEMAAAAVQRARGASQRNAEALLELLD